MEKRKLLSLCMLTKNDEKYIIDCLQAVKDVVDEIIVVDIGSEDKTVQLAEQAGAKVYPIKWGDNYSEAKNLCLDHAEGRWVLFLYANEFIEEEQLDELTFLMNNPNAEGYLMYISYSPEANHLFYPSQSLRLLRNRKEYRFIYKSFERIPEDILSNIEDSNIQISRRENVCNSDVKDMDCMLLEAEFIEHPEDSYLQYIYGIVLLNRQMYKESIECFQNALQNANFDYLFVPHLFKCLSWSLIYDQQNEEAMSVLNEGVRAFPFYSDLLVLRGQLNMELKNYKDAIRDLEGSLRVRARPNFSIPAPEIDTVVILEILGEAHMLVGNNKMALACYQQAYELDNSNIELIGIIDDLIAKLEDKENLHQ